jgi:ATP-binding cassette subfamily B protein
MNYHSLPKNLTDFIWFFCKSYRKYLLLLLLTLLVLSTIPSIDGYLAKRFINDVNNNLTTRDYIIYPLLFFVWWESINIFWRLADFCLLKITPHIRVAIIDKATSYCYQHSYKFFQENFSGSIASKISELAKGVERIINFFFMEFFRKICLITFAVTTLGLINIVFAIILLLWCSIFIILSYFFSKNIENISNQFAASRALGFGKIVDSITNISNIRIFSRHNYERKYLQTYLDDICEKDQKLKKYELKTNYIKGLFNSLGITLMIVSLIYFKDNNKITIGDFALILTICIGVLTEIWNFSQQLSEFSEYVGTCKQSLTLITTNFDIKDVENAKPLIVKEGKLVFDQVNFSYQGRHNLFGNKSVIIEAGQKVGLVGYSGSGKSTFVNLIIRLFDVNSGQILIDGQNIAQVTQESLRSVIGFIPQDPILFHRSIKENIRYGKIDACDDDIYNAAKQAYAHDFIMNMSEGYDSTVGERGVKLSGGQRQRIAIARAFLKNAPILILDEATSSLDSVTERLIQGSLYQLMEGKTTIVIAHRLSTLLHMDRILVFNRGEIIQDSTHQELISRKGLYKSLWDAQANGFLPSNKKF